MGFLQRAKAVKTTKPLVQDQPLQNSKASSFSSGSASSQKKKKKTPQFLIDEVVVEQIIAVLEGNFGTTIQEKDLKRIWKKVKEALHVKRQAKKLTQEKRHNASQEATDKALNQEEILKILTTAHAQGIKEDILAELFFELGLKLAEIVQLKVEDLDRVKKTLKVGRRTIKLNDELFQKILNVLQGRKNGYIFSDGKKPMTTASLLQLLESLMEQAGVQKRKNLESAVDQFFRSLHQQGKPFLYWEHQDYIIQLRNQEIQKHLQKKQ